MNRFLKTAALLATVAGLAVACGDTPAENTGAAAGSSDTAPPPAAVLPDGLLLDAAPEGARNVAEVKAAAQEGEEVVIRGRIGGTFKPFMEGRAVLTLADPVTIQSCAEMGADDHCPTPWDYCCMTQEDKTAGTATIQVLGPDGRPLTGGLQGLAGFDPLTILVVRGKVGPRPDPGVLVVDATGIFVEK